jgi:hypothetical protein
MLHLQNAKIVPIVCDSLDNASATTAAIDTVGYDYCEIIVVTGNVPANIAALKVQESDDSGMSGAADVTGLVYGTSTTIDNATSTLPTAASGDDKSRLFQIDLKKRKRYLDLVLTAGDGSGTGTDFAAIAILSRAGESPADTAAGKGVTEAVRV